MDTQLIDPNTEPTMGSLLKLFVDRGVTKDNVEAFGKLVEMQERREQRDAQKEFNAAFAKLQAELPVIVAQTIIPNRGKYERFEDVMAKVSPVLAANGFSISFSMDFKEGRVIETCCLRHIGGHSQSNSFAVRTGKADTDTQADCKAATTAKRNALLNALNIVIRQDVLQGEEGEDASLEGAFIVPDKVQYLREQVRELGANEEAFLAMAGAKCYEEICNGSYPTLVRSLELKRKAKK